MFYFSIFQPSTAAVIIATDSLCASVVLEYSAFNSLPFYWCAYCIGMSCLFVDYEPMICKYNIRIQIVCAFIG